MLKHSCLSYALFLIKRRPRTKSELVARLESRGFPAEEITATIDRLTKKQIIDDSRYARALMNDRVRLSRRGRQAIVWEMKKRGLDQKLIEQTINQLDQTDELQAARELVTSRQRVWLNLPESKRKQRTISLLRQRGFSARVVCRLWQEIEQNKSDWH